MLPAQRIALPGRPRRLILLGLLCLAALALASCYDPEPFEATVVSPDGRFLALTTPRRELSLLDLTRGEPAGVLSREAAGGMGWSPDSQRLAYVSRPANRPSSLMLVDINQGRPEPLRRGAAWKESPVFLADGRVAFLSDEQSDRAGIWVADPRDRSARRILQVSSDISHLWATPGGDRLVFQAATSDTLELWSWRPEAGAPPVRLTPRAPGRPATTEGLAFSRDGHRVAYCARQTDRIELVWQDLDTTQVLARLPLSRPATDLAVTRDGRVAAGQGEAVLLWRPEGPFWRRKLTRSAWNGVSLQVIGPLGSRGLVFALNHNIVLSADNAARPAGGRLQPRHAEDLLALAYPLAQNGQFKAARDLLGNVEGRVAKGSRQEYLTDMAWSQLERRQGRWTEADQSLARALRIAEPGSPEAETAWLERLALALYNAKDRPLANWVLEKLPKGPDKAPLTTWTRDLLEKTDPWTARQWFEIASSFRGGNDDATANLVYKTLQEVSPSTTTLRGIALLVGGDFEPLGEVGDIGQRRLETLLEKPEFQIALLSIVRRNLSGGPTPAEAGSLLLGQWVRQGDFSSARELVRASLKQSSESIPDYLEMLRRFIVLEEADRLLQRAVTDVLLQKDIAEVIDGRLDVAEERLLLRLAQIKKALIDGDAVKAREWLADARTLEAKIQAANDDPAAAFDRAQGMFLIHLFTAKIAEQTGHWQEALDAYEDCLELMNEVPGSWEVSPFEVAMAAELIRTGMARDTGLLRDYMAVLRGSGDPLLNPTHAPATIEVGLSNLATLRRVAPEPWIQPYLTYTEGLYQSLLQHSWRALELLGRARRQNAPPALRQRILLEEGAIRDTLGQNELAARIYRQIDGAAGTPPPQRAAAIQAAIQSEAAVGEAASPPARLKETLARAPLPKPWEEWLALQVGSDAQE